MLKRVWDLQSGGLGTDPILPLATCVTLSKGLDFSKAWFFLDKNETIMFSCEN